MSDKLEQAPIMRIFKLGVKEDRLAEFLSIGHHNLTQSLEKEEGTLAMYATHIENQPLETVIVEIYRDQEAYQKHIQADHFQAFANFAQQGLTDRQVFETQPILLLEKEQGLLETASSKLTLRFAEIEVKADCLTAFLDVVTAEMKESLIKEAGVLAMYVTSLADRANSLRFFEIYQDDLAYEAHRQTSHFQDYLQQTADMIESKSLFELEADTLVSQGGLSFEA